jgi:hypothetical protein
MANPFIAEVAEITCWVRRRIRIMMWSYPSGEFSTPITV